METLLEQVFATYKSAMKDLECLELKNNTLEEEVGKLKNQIAELTNRRCPNCGERKESIESHFTQNVDPAESSCSKSAENLVFNDEAATTILRRQKRRKKEEPSSQERKKRRMVRADVTSNSAKTPEGHKLMQKLETESTQFPEPLNPAQILVEQTCEVDSDVNNGRSVYKNAAEWCDQISVIPETVPMDFEPDEKEYGDFDDRLLLKPVSDKSVVVIDTSDNDSLRDAPDSVRKMFIGSQSHDTTVTTKLDFDTEGKVTEGDPKEMSPESKVRDGRRAKSLTPKGQKVKAGEVSIQLGYTQALQLLSDSESQPMEKSEAEASLYSPVKKGLKNGGRGQRRDSMSSEFARLENGSDGSRSPVFDGVGVQDLNHEHDDKTDQVQQNSGSGTNSKKSPLVSQGFKVGSNQSSGGSSDSPVVIKHIVNKVKITYDAKNLPLDKLSEGSEVRIDVAGESETNSYIVSSNGIRKDTQMLDVPGRKNSTDSDKLLESVNAKSQSSMKSQESEMSGSQSLVSSRMSLHRSSNRQTGTDMNSSGEENIARSLAQSKSDSHLLHQKKSKSVGLPSPMKSKHSSLPNSPLSVSQTFKTKLATDVRNSDDEFKSDAGFKNSAEEVWLSAKKPEPKKHRVKTPLNITLNTTVTSSPKNFRQQTIDLTLKKNTEMDLSEAATFNGGVLSSKKSNGADNPDMPNLSFEFDEDEEDENVPPSPQKPMSQKFRRPKTFATGAKSRKRESADLTFDPDLTRLPFPGTEVGSEVTCIDASPCYRKNAGTPIGTTETNFHDSEMDTSYSLLPAAKYNGTIDPDLNLSAYMDSVVSNNDQSEMSDKILSKSCSVVFGKDGNIAGSSAQSVADPLLCTESNLLEEVPFHSTCRSVTFGKGGTVSAGLPPNFSELASEIPQNSEFPVAPGHEVAFNRRKIRNRSRHGKPEADLLDSEVSPPLPQSSKLGSRKAKNRSQKKSPEKPSLLLNPDYDSQLDFAGQDSEKSFKFSGRPKRGIKSQETAPSTVSRKSHSKVGQKKFEASQATNDNSKNQSSKFSQKLMQGLDKTSKRDVSGVKAGKGPKSALPDETSYVLTEKLDDAVMVSGNGGDFENDGDAMMADMCKSMKFGARPKTFAEVPQSPDELDILLFDANNAGSEVNEGKTDALGIGNQKDVDLEEDSQGLGDDDEYPCPGIVATPVDESEKSISRRRRKERKEQRLIDNSFDRVPKDDGPDYAYCKVERNRQKRNHCMHGHDCAGCKDYYDYLPEEERQKRMQESSRHRAYYVPPDTPPNFWCLNIPSTQSLSMNMKGHLDESYSAEVASNKSPEPKPAKAKGKEKFRRKNKLTILPPKFDDKS